ncbi:MAG: YifB family Mg chelatase-like AAA ATPase [Gammaproteobacteria bacterium]|nr:YifB family Mg chelatase-like AAA ATPase [Gammaproteobacteria bacterium]
MSTATVFSRARIGIDAPEIKIEVHISNGLPAFQIVGLPDTSVRESRDRVRSALINSNFQFPQTRLTINLSPADIPKEGARFDLAIAIGILAASNQLPTNILTNNEFYGELGLSGDLRDIIGAIPSVLSATQNSRTCIMPAHSAQQAAVIKNAEIIPANSLLEVFHHLSGQQTLTLQANTERQTEQTFNEDLADVIGQHQAKRALEIAAAGQHNMLFIGPPGTGKSMLASRIQTILPEMSDEEALETAAIHSISGKEIDYQYWKKRIVRCPHHTCSGVALVGGGSIPKPGEASLSHNGVLFLDELPEFDRKVLDVLREPLETGKITISRAAQQAEFPARFQLIAALNPSPTGHYNDGRSNKDTTLKYLNKISGPLLDRIEIQIEVPSLKQGELSQPQDNRENSKQTRQRVITARSIMLKRAGKPNAQLSNKELNRDCQLSPPNQQFLETTIHKLNLSIRVYHKILKVARTIADLEGNRTIEKRHLAEALSYRAMDKIIKHLTQ